MLKLDAHQHFWNFNEKRDQWITADMEIIRHDFLPQDLWPSLLENGVEGSIAIQAGQSASETMFLLALAATTPFIKGVVGWIDLCLPDIDEQLLQLQGFPDLKGFRHLLQDEPDDRFMLGTAFRNGLACLQRSGYTFDLLIFPRHLSYAAELAEEFPLLNFVIDHLAKPDLQQTTGWLKGMERISAFQNVYCKVSGLLNLKNSGNMQAYTPVLDHVAHCFGIDRLMYGSDWPVCLTGSSYAEVMRFAASFSSRFSEAGQEAFWSGNASRFYQLIR